MAAVAEPPVAWVPPDEETLGVTRRQFFNRGIIALFGFGLSIFGAQVIAFLWPQPKGGFGSKITAGKLDLGLVFNYDSPQTFSFLATSVALTPIQTGSA